MEMARARTARLASAVALIVVSGSVLAVPGRVDATPEADRTAATPAPGVAAETPVQTLAHSIGELGRTTYYDLFAGLTVDGERGRVIVYTTDVDMARRMVDQGRSAAPASARNGAVVEIRQAKYARPQLEQTSARLWQEADRWKAAGAPIYAIVLRADGSGLDVRTSEPTRLSGLLGRSAALAGAPVAVADVEAVPGWQIRSVSRDNPSPPYQGGIPIRWDWELFLDWNCTAAFGVTRPGGPEYLLTAEHCFDVGDRIEDANDDFIGGVRQENVQYDAAIIETDVDGPWIWTDQSSQHGVRNVLYSWNGERVCQSGRTLQRRCDIQVTDEWVQWQDETGNVRTGVEGWICGGCAAVDHGDSGGPVYGFRSDNYIDARGIVSAGGRPLSGENCPCEFIYWTEIPDVLRSMNLGIYVT